MQTAAISVLLFSRNHSWCVTLGFAKYKVKKCKLYDQWKWGPLKPKPGYAPDCWPNSSDDRFSSVVSVRIRDVKLFVTINGLVGDVSVCLKFSNNFVSSGPAVFLFPLTHNASVKQCQAVVNSVTGFSRSVSLECHPVDGLEKTKVSVTYLQDLHCQVLRVSVVI